MAESRENGGGSRSSLFVQPAAESSPEASTRELDAGEGARMLSASGVNALKKADMLGRYVVLKQLGAGAMGVVYAAYDPELDRKIAIKILRPEQGKGDSTRHRERLVREAKAMAKLSHPNVGAIHDVGVHGSQVFLAMEFLSGGTLRDWVDAKKRPWREIVRMFIEVGRGLAGAHAEGLIHRDFKPDNVLIDKSGVPKVVDFGLVRLTSGALDQSITGSIEATGNEDDAAALPVAQTALAALTRTGALTGTPAYMAPEQFLGKEIDARTDQFSFCVALYEALYGERPFAGKTLISLADAVTSEKVRPAPKTSDVPTWVRRCLLRGLRGGPDQRYAKIADLLGALENDPVAHLRRRIGIVAVSAAAIVGTIAVRHAIVSKRQEIEKQVAEHVSAADSSLAEADSKNREAKSLRSRAFAAFDNYQRDDGEGLWAQSLAAAKTADADYQQAIQQLEAAITLTPRRDLKNRIADAFVDSITIDGRTPAERDAGLRQLKLYDEGGARMHRLTAPARLRLDTSPSGLTARIESYDPVTFRLKGPARSVGKTPLDLTLDAGSYRVTFEETGSRVGFQYPVALTAAEHLQTVVNVPSRSAVPEGFVYIPEGRFMFGSGNEEIRTAFLLTVPLHAMHLPAFLISDYEVTIAEWIAFLDTLPRHEQNLRRPHGNKDEKSGSIDVKKTRDGWEIAFSATDQTFHARQGEPLKFSGRTRRVSQDWMHQPVTGVSPTDALLFVDWLNKSGRVPGARLCTEGELERAARGADAREFPAGNTISADDANFDVTYGRKSDGLGPDEVGSHPGSRSPFLVDDLSGNVWEIATSILDRGQFVVRGGSFYQGELSLRTSNRDPIFAATRDHTVGLRVCANVAFDR
ncbi:MAG TPA: bifunctional serine/threonine-protein kinase/formylglycine-generating enzyme family protein [Polyangia bacterium]|nr:bifunctional serine/threonine-protein kinase/formylglycine-generating enzyme family protein [Polyangia bacterium]